MWKKTPQGLKESKSKETFFLFLKTSLGNLKIQNQTTASLCENIHENSK